MSEAIDITSIGRSRGRLTGPIFLRAVDQLHLLEFHSARSKDWPVNRQACVDSVQYLIGQSYTRRGQEGQLWPQRSGRVPHRIATSAEDSHSLLVHREMESWRVPLEYSANSV